MKKLLATALALLTLFMLASCSKSPGSENTGEFVLGFCNPLSGSNAEAGTQCLNAVTLAVNQINARGGLNGEQVKIISYDDEANPATSLSNMTKLCTTDNANAIVGSIMSSCVLGQIQTINQYKIPVFTGGTSPSLTAEGSKYIFRTTMNQDYAMTDIMNAYKTMGVKKVALFTAQDEAQIASGDQFKASCEELGIEVIGWEYCLDGDTDYTAQCTRLYNLNPEAIFFATPSQPQPLFVKQIREMGYKGTLWNKESFQQNGIQIAGSTSDYVCFSWPCVSYTDENDASGVMKEFLTAYKAEYGSLPTSDCAYRGYDAVLVLEEACKIAKSNDRQAIADAIATINNLDALGGKMDFTINAGEGYQKGQLYYVYDGKYHSFQEWLDGGNYDAFKETLN
ncbi:MAG TPA: ABC transporter substrate-binding protein [Syntrophomonas sp.]|nr:ABC transporter substrate-binding protein [Syntrophomonas sp.]